MHPRDLDNCFIMGGSNLKKRKKFTLDDYEITTEGEVINIHNKHKRVPQPNSKGYLRVMINGKNLLVHRLVAQKYVPNPENKPQVNHIDGNKLNNNYTNLEWVTNQENRNHAIEKGLHLCGENCSWSKLKEKDVVYILQNPNITVKELCLKFNVARSTIDGIRKGKHWKQLKRYAEL